VASADLVPQNRIDSLSSAYLGYRSCLHHRALDGASAIVPASEFVAERAAIKQRINLKLGSTILEEKSYQPYR